MTEKRKLKLLERSSLGDSGASMKLGDFYFDEFQIQFFSENAKKSEWKASLTQAKNYYKLSIKQGNGEGYRGLADCYCSVGDLDRCFYYFKPYLACNKKDDDDLFTPFINLASTHRPIRRVITEKGLSDFFTCLKTVLKRHRDCTTTKYCFKLFVMGALEPASLNEIFDLFLSDKEEWNQLSSVIGRYYLEQGNEEEGLQWLAVGDKHHDAASAETLGDFYSGVFNKRKTNYDLAVFYYERAVSLGSNPAAISLADSLIKLDKNLYREKIVTLLDGTERKDMNDATLVRLGEGYNKIGEGQTANFIYKEGYENGLLECGLHFATNLRDGVGIESNIEDAMNVFEELVALGSNRSSSTKMLGEIYREFSKIYCSDQYDRKNDKKARALLKEGAELENPFCMFHYAEYLMMEDKTEEALTWKKKAINCGYNPDDIDEQTNVLSAQRQNSEDSVLSLFKKLQGEQGIILTKLDQHDRKLDAIQAGVEDVKNQVKSLSSSVLEIKKDFSKSFLGLEEDTRAYEELISKIEEGIIKVAPSKCLSSPKETTGKLKTLFGDEWDKLSPESQNYLITANTVFDSMCAEDQERKLDYSAVCVMVCKSIEAEFKRRFFTGFIRYLESVYHNNCACYHSQLVDCTSKPPYRFVLKQGESITLGDIPYILCFPKSKQKFGSNYDYNSKQIVEFSNQCVFKNPVDQKALDELSSQIIKIKNDYRNPSCHSEPVLYVTARECLDYVIDSTKFLIHFLSGCKY